ncbi:hypothetical protein [Paucisalibacillus sp. EB02]|uniref:hypothetical protein n=1 Tax=Paucisalibacillus sp. EB02 TaxID=1347087 RepID=UPI0004B8B18D|nr:hypothetical protein [Paucisalibacillus sp. EB02]
MKRKNFYEKLPAELLGCFYCFVEKKIKNGENLGRMLFEMNQIEKVARERGISLLELRIIGHWFIQKENNITKHEIE